MRSSAPASVRRLRFFLQRLVAFLRVSFDREGLRSARGRTLIRGKLRRSLLSLSPPLSRYLQRRYGMSGECSNCGASCNLLFQCPHWDSDTKLCSIYEDRPNVCRLYPITPADLCDRDLVAPHHPCSYHFANAHRKSSKHGTRVTQAPSAPRSSRTL